MIRFLQTPGPLKKILLGGLLTIICVFMVITLVPGFGNSSFFGTDTPTRGIVASVDGNDVTSLEVQKTAKSMVERQFPRGGPQAAMLVSFFAGQAAQQLINEQVILAEAHRLGLRATDADVRDELQHGMYSQVFFPGGNFIGQDEYEQKLQENNLTIPQFENDIKNQVLFEKVRNLVGGTATVTDAEIRDRFEKENTKVKFDYAVLKKDDLLKTINPTEAELKAFYEKNKANYNNSIPEKRKISYVVVDTSKVQAQTQISPDDLKSYYTQHQDEYRVPDQVNVRHILIKTPLPGADGKVDQKAVDAAKQRAEDLLKQLKSGAKFEDLANKYSDDKDSAKNGGSLGWIQRGRFGSADEDKIVFALAKGATSDVISTTSGFDIVRVDDKQDAHLKTLDEVKSQIEPILKQQKASQQAEAIANTLTSQARSQGLDKAAASKNFEVVNTDFVARGDSLPGVGTAPQLMDAIFSASEKAPPDEAAIPQGFAIYQVLAIKPPATPTFDEIHTRVEKEFKDERSETLLTQKTQELADRAKAEHDLKKAAKELGATVKTSELVLPDGQVPDVGSMSGPASVAFTMKPGDISGPIEAANSGVVLSVLEKQEPNQQDFATKRDEIRNALMQQRQQEAFGLFVDNVRQQMEKSGKIKINQEELKSLTKQQSSEGDEGE
jgi:peptidyl-prolyl cis-trans isomerase D